MAQTAEGAMKVAAKRIGVCLAEYRSNVAKRLKHCRQCRTWKDVFFFQRDRSRHDGRAPVCRGCLLGVGTKTEKLKASWIERRKTFVPPMKGKTHSLSTREKISAALRGKPGGRLGKLHTLEARARMSRKIRERTPRGKDCHSYKDGKLAERRGQRFSREYKRWRFDVFMRDKFTCQDCGDKKGGNLRAHHLKPFADFPELRFTVSNGITLCDPCHDKRHGR